ncbi:MAG: DUF305 domain-containing protein [Balneolaceae bacterium]|nr:DUF305 domain-containing protein [Balneolaceae bacterium]
MSITKFKSHHLKQVTYVVLGLFLLVGATACSSTSNTLSNTNTSSGSQSELEELYWARQDSARMNFTEADVKFMTGMIAHHAQALIMSRLAPENHASPQVQTLTSRIINAQKDEIKTMQAWLRDRGQPVPEIHIDGLELTITGVSDKPMKVDHTKMAGILSPQQLKELSEAEGKEFDRLFLKYMIYHHKGAVTMVEKLVNTDGAAQDEAAFKLASDIQVDQRTEIDRMRLMLEQLSDASR